MGRSTLLKSCTSALTYNFSTFSFKTMNRILLIASTLSLALTTAAQQAPEQFSVATLNVAGLPQKILFINVNSKGPGTEGSLQIGQYLSDRQYDMVFTQEDFNYHDALTFMLKDDYQIDTWTGDVDVIGHDIDFLHPQNHRFECDGLGACVKKNITIESVSRTLWNTYFGKFSHALDEMVTKGFRRYELTLASGRRLVVYNMHMDASDRNDVYDGTDQKDRQARRGEWIQLRDDIMEKLDERPVIVVGDLNSFYVRDTIQADFIEAINATGRAKASDVWVELEHEGQYPELREITTGIEREGYEVDGECYDKIIYINPTNGQQLKAVAYNRDKENFVYNGKPLSDHSPVSAVFEWTAGSKESDTGIESASHPDAHGSDSELFDLNGRRIKTTSDKGIFIERNDKGTFKHIIK